MRLQRIKVKKQQTFCENERTSSSSSLAFIFFIRAAPTAAERDLHNITHNLSACSPESRYSSVRQPYTLCSMSKSFSFCVYSSCTFNFPACTKFCFSRLKSWSVCDDKGMHYVEQSANAECGRVGLFNFTLMRISLTFSCASCMIKLTICLICLLESDDILPAGW